MNFLIDRIENPGTRTTLLPSSFPNKLQKKIDKSHEADLFSNNLKRKSAASKTRHLAPTKSQNNIKLPILSINDEPILESEPSRIGLASYFSQRHNSEEGLSFKTSSRRKHLESQPLPDYSAASLGTFSDCIFNDALSKEPTLTNAKGNYLDGGEKCLRSRRQSSIYSSRNTSPYKRRTSSFGASGPLGFSQVQNSGKQLKNKRSNSNNHSTNLASDKKRLVNEFLNCRNGPGKSPTISEDNLGETGWSIATKSNNNNQEQMNLFTDQSLSDILFHDLDTPSQPISKSRSNSSSFPSSTSTVLSSISPSKLPVTSSSLSIYSSSSTRSSFSSTSSSASSYETSPIPLPIMGKKTSLAISPKATSSAPEDLITNDELRATTTLNINCNELNYYQTHICNTLAEFERLLKQNLQTFVIKDEADLHGTLSKFDNLTFHLQNMKNRIDELYDVINEKYLSKIKTAFNEDDESSFEFELRTSVEASIKQLEELENRMEYCQLKLQEQRETMRQLDNLILIENSLLESKKNVKHIYSYRFLVFDILVIFVVLYFGYWVKKIIGLFR
ncbi:hypothetical protein NCAS_0I00120 [Naumovozyma castellii]|uniref:Uncharacterized protein n=1 Tax=Naumovozyma castellii TaxID=27288 RepID=G0VJK0_NAUCA|nr:hypothetical protein NCAS_0I00120 [Naumovozyma castellii CBS 4309]CCC71680.1 hypothetical protein NCAS_0I00120 [Naumovozyma castellii CBS 4309]